jgi:hypothetical protein
MEKKRRYPFWLMYIALSGLMMFLLACSGGGDGSPETAVYRITVTNLTHNQPLSPPVVVLHAPGYTAWRAGTAASEALERLAEGGEADAFINRAATDANVMAVSAGSGLIGPGASGSVEIEVGRDSDLRLSFAAMLVNTNDAFTGMTDVFVGGLEVDGQMMRAAPVYDAGTEANTETPASVPGPAAGGEGYNPARDDADMISVHPGVLTRDEGLTASALDESHRWLNPAARLTVMRTK